MSNHNATLLKLAAAVAQRQAQHAHAAQQQAQAAQAVTQDMVRQLAADMVREMRDNATPAIDKRDGAQLVREAFSIENMVRGVFQELKDELRGADGKNVSTEEAEALVRAVFAEIEPHLHGRDGDNATPDMVATAVADWLRANPPAAGRNATPEQVAAAVAAYLAANPPKPGKDGNNATPDMVAAAVAKWLQANPPKAGPPGPAPQHEVKGRKIRWRQPDGSWGPWIELGGKNVVIGGGGGMPAAGGLKVEYFDTAVEFPDQGAANVLYVARAASYTADSETETADTEEITADAVGAQYLLYVWEAGSYHPIGGKSTETFETIAENLRAADEVRAFNEEGDLISVTYSDGIVKTLEYNDNGDQFRITLSGSTPAGIKLVKTRTFDANGNITEVKYT